MLHKGKTTVNKSAVGQNFNLKIMTMSIYVSANTQAALGHLATWQKNGHVCKHGDWQCVNLLQFEQKNWPLASLKSLSRK